VAAIVLGSTALEQISEGDEEGWGLATAAVILGCIGTALFVLWMVRSAM
jgi:hypothetical protein